MEKIPSSSIYKMTNSLRQRKVEHRLLAKALHWIFIVTFGYGVFKQIQSKEQLNDIGLLKSEFLFALFFLIFLVFRFVYMKKKYKSSLPSKTLIIHRLAAKFIHISMYVTLSGIVISGLGVGFFFWFGYQKTYLLEFTILVLELPLSIATWLISLHVLAAIYHRVRHDFFWSSMVPFFKGESWKDVL